MKPALKFCRLIMPLYEMVINWLYLQTIFRKGIRYLDCAYRHGVTPASLRMAGAILSPPWRRLKSRLPRAILMPDSLNNFIVWNGFADALFGCAVGGKKRRPV